MGVGSGRASGSGACRSLSLTSVRCKDALHASGNYGAAQAGVAAGWNGEGREERGFHVDFSRMSVHMDELRRRQHSTRVSLDRLRFSCGDEALREAFNGAQSELRNMLAATQEAIAQ